MTIPVPVPEIKHPYNTRRSAKFSQAKQLEKMIPYVDLSRSIIDDEVNTGTDRDSLESNEEEDREQFQGPQRLQRPQRPQDAFQYSINSRPSYWEILVSSFLTVCLVVLVLSYYEMTIDVERVKKETSNQKKAMSSMKDTIWIINDSMATTVKLIEEIKKEIKEKYKIYDYHESNSSGKVKPSRPDFALSTAGGAIIRAINTAEFNNGTLSGKNYLMSNENHDPVQLISPGNAPGQCWAFRGSTGTVEIKLLGKVKIDSFSLEHIPKNLSPSGNLKSAPKEFYVTGLNACDSTDGDLLGEFTYRVPGLTLQIFRLDKPTSKAYQFLRFSVRSNYGNSQYTCVYRFQVHGTPIPGSFDL